MGTTGTGNESWPPALRSRARAPHGEIDAGVRRAYGREDLGRGHGDHEHPNLAETDCVRFTISDAARAEVLRLFAKLNRQHFEEEQAAAPAHRALDPFEQPLLGPQPRDDTLRTHESTPSDRGARNRAL